MKYSAESWDKVLGTFKEGPNSGHKYFRYAINGVRQGQAVAIADYSGRYPHQTDDGVLWIDFERGIEFHEDNSASLALIDDKNERTRTPVSTKEAFEVAAAFDIKVNVMGTPYVLTDYRDVKRREDTIKISWSLSDVLSHAEEIDVEITEADARKVLGRLKKNHDATVGINWDIIAANIRCVATERAIALREDS